MTHNWQIMIGVDTSGRLLIGAAAVRSAEADGELAASETIWPSQLGHRAAVHRCRELWPGPESDVWEIVTNRRAIWLSESGRVDLVKKYPRADGSKSIRRRRYVVTQNQEKDNGR